jgi:uncharacterized RDD family membrane protein YckC
MSEKSPAVLFNLSDYANFPRRLTSWLIDLCVMVLVLIALGVYVEWRYVPRDVIAMPPGPQRQREITKHFKPYQMPVLGGWTVAFASYHILLRRTRGGTIGYRLTRIRVVDQTGEPPSWSVLTKRFLIALPAAGPLGATYLPCRSHDRRQSVHDRWAGTWVVRASVNPAGEARAIYQTKLFGTILLTYVDLEPLNPRPIVQ